jgi:hypothetical protein
LNPGNGYGPLPQKHYTISEDATAADLRNKLYAIAERKDFSDMFDPHLMGSSVQGRPETMPAGIQPRVHNPNYRPPPAIGIPPAQIRREPANQKSSRSYSMIPKDTDDSPSVDQSPRMDVHLMEHLIRRIQELEATNIQFQEHQKEDIQDQQVKIQVFHTIFQGYGQRVDNSQDSDQSSELGGTSATFLSAPYWDVHDGHASLRSIHHVPDPRGYLQRKGDISLVIYKCYDTAHQRKEVDEAIRNNEPLPEPTPTSEEFMLLSEKMIEAAKCFFDQDAGLRNEFPWLDLRKRISPPFLWWYHYRRKLDPDSLQPRSRKLITELILWLESTYGSFYDHVDAKLYEGLVSSTYFQYLVRPGDVLVQNRGSLSQGYLAKSHPKSVDSDEENIEHQKARFITKWEISASSLTYDRKLMWEDVTIKVQLVAESANQYVPITDLNYIPLDYSSAEVIRQLEARGHQKFWGNQRGQLVSYKSDTGENKSVVSPVSFPYGQAFFITIILIYPSNQNERYMIDFKTYNELHPSSNLVDAQFFVPGVPRSRPYKPKDGEDPAFPESFLFPSETKGFNFRTKKWC